MPTKSSILRFFPVVGDFFQQKHKKQQYEKQGVEALAEVQRRFNAGTMDPILADYAFRAGQNQDAGLAMNILRFGQDPQMLENVKQTHTKGFMKDAGGYWRNPTTGGRPFPGAEHQEVLADQIAEVERRREVKKLGETVAAMPEGQDQEHAKNLMNLGKPDDAANYLSELTNPQMLEDAETQRLQDEAELRLTNAQIREKNMATANREMQTLQLEQDMEAAKNANSPEALNIAASIVKESIGQIDNKTRDRARYETLLEKLDSHELKTGPFDTFMSDWFFKNADRELLDAMAILVSRGELKQFEGGRTTDADMVQMLIANFGADKTENFNRRFIQEAIIAIDKHLNHYDNVVDEFFPGIESFQREDREYHFKSPQQ